MVSKDWPGSYATARDGFQFCVPDTSGGACIGLGSYAPYAMSWHMACGKQGKVGAKFADNITGDSTQPTPSLTATQKLAAMAFSDALALASQLPPCTCEADWSLSKLAEKYCGANKVLAKGSISNETCFNAPSTFDNSLSKTTKGKFDWGYYRKDQSPKQEYAIAKWCKVPTTGCAVEKGGMDECTGERFMATHMRNMKSLAVSAVPARAVMAAAQYSNGVGGISMAYSRKVMAKKNTL